MLLAELAPRRGPAPMAGAMAARLASPAAVRAGLPRLPHYPQPAAPTG